MMIVISFWSTGFAHGFQRMRIAPTKARKPVGSLQSDWHKRRHHRLQPETRLSRRGQHEASAFDLEESAGAVRRNGTFVCGQSGATGVTVIPVISSPRLAAKENSEVLLRS
jgi:hypothetical protein